MLINNINMILTSFPLVSVLIPVYNVEKFVKEAIDSIQNQTYKNLEIIVVDDCSTDATYNIVKSMAVQDKRINLVKNKKNLKISRTLNKALDLATGDYIARMDGDDISALDRIEKKIQFLEENSQFDLVGCSLIAIDVHNKKIGESIYFSKENILKKTVKYVTPVSHIWVAKRSLYDKLNGYRNISGVEDYDFLLRMNSLKLRYTNLEDYFGYFVRLGRDGNTISSYGIKQRKLRSYAYLLFKERESTGLDTFSEENLSNFLITNSYLEKIHSYSSLFLFKSIKFKSEKKYLSMFFFISLSMISPYQIVYLVQRIKYFRIINKYN